MSHILLALEFRKINYSQCLAFADFLTFENFLMFLDLAGILSFFPALLLPPLSALLSSTANAIRKFSHDPVKKIVLSIEVNSPAILSKPERSID